MDVVLHPSGLVVLPVFVVVIHFSPPQELAEVSGKALVKVARGDASHQYQYPANYCPAKQCVQHQYRLEIIAANTENGGKEVYHREKSQDQKQN